MYQSSVFLNNVLISKIQFYLNFLKLLKNNLIVSIMHQLCKISNVSTPNNKQSIDMLITFNF